MTKLTNFIFRSSLALVAIFAVVTVAGAEPTEVNDFYELKDAINRSEKEIVIKNTIDFTANGPVINCNDMVISGPSENAPGLLDGNSSYKFFIFGKNAKNISLNNLHLKNGSSGNESDYRIGGGAINLDAGVVVNLENLIFSGNQTKFQGGAIYSWGTDNNNRNSLNFTGETTFDGNKTIGTDSNGGAIFACYSTLTFGGGLATFEGNSSTKGGGAIYGHFGTKLTFGGDVVFIGNNSVGHGGAIRSWEINVNNKNILEFEGNATFVRNSATGNVIGEGGAIYIWNSSITFGGLATFENNSSRGNGGAIYAYYSASIEFNNGLRLIGN
ncbi:MAG: hypothetical protein LBB13_03890, partial [Rickettsiales bacterium]|nr:hypothetical protein [Rickettsiales bacterium]